MARRGSGTGNGRGKNLKPARALTSRVEGLVGTDGALIRLPVRELRAKLVRFSILRLQNGPPGVRKGKRQRQKSKTGTTTYLEGRETCRN